jgi:septum formation protein
MNKKIYLASKSPRRQELLKLMGLEYTLYLKDVDESYPEDLTSDLVAEFIAKKKLADFEVPADGILITADTIVVLGEEILGKPTDEQDAFEMIRKLSGKKHLVITGVCMKSIDKEISFSEITEVYFKELSDEQISFYVSTYQPLDKAGAYGIQEWVGLVGIERINGSYTNVVGLPTEKMYSALATF